MSCHPRALVSEFMMVLDFFNDAVYLNLNGKRNLATAMGGLLSLTLIGVLLYQGISQSVEMFNRDSATIYQVGEYDSTPNEIYINKTNNFFFAIGTSINDVDIDMTSQSLFNFSVGYNQYTRYKNGTKIKLKSKIFMAPCNESDFTEEVFGKNVFTLNALNYAFCPTGIDYTNPTTGVCPPAIKENYPGCVTPPDFRLKGAYLSKSFEFIQFNLTLCNSTSSNLPYKIACASGNITSTILQNTVEINLYYSNSMVNPVFYDKPNKTLIDTMYWNLNPQIYKIADIYIDKVMVQDFDRYYESDSYTNRSFYAIPTEKLREMQIVRFEDQLPLLQWNLRRSSMTALTTRTYSTVQDVMTNLGGFSSNLVFVAAILALGYVRYKYQMILSNELYDFQALERDHKPSSKPKAKPTAKKEIELATKKFADEDIERKDSGKDGSSYSSGFALDSNSRVVKNYFEQHIKKRKKIKHNEVTYLQSLLSFLCCKKKPDQQLASTARNLVLEDLDIIKVINKVKEVDKLKLLLLNRYQREAFNFIEKPLIAVEGKKPVYRNSILIAQARERDTVKTDKATEKFHQMLKAKEDSDPLLKYTRLYMTYRSLKEDKDPANEKYNKKLVDLIDHDLIQVFQIMDEKMGEDSDPSKFEEIIRKIMESPSETFSSDSCSNGLTLDKGCFIFFL